MVHVGGHHSAPPTPRPPSVGDMDVVLLAGGPGTRMGEPKAHLDVDGDPLWRVVADRLADLGCAVVVACGPDRWDATPHVAVTDPGVGPLGGIAAAGRLLPGADLLVWTVDVPDPDRPDLDALAEPSHCVRSLTGRDGRVQPLLARWPARAVAGIDPYLASGHRSVHGFLDEVGVESVGPRRHRVHLTTSADVSAWLARRRGPAPSV